MKISARNQFRGKITKITKGAVNGIVELDVNGEKITSTISMGSIEELGLKAGKEAVAVIKATEVMITPEKHLAISARNQIRGKVTEVEEGAVNGIVKLDADCGCKVSATISMNAIKELGIAAGKEATAVIKATSVMIATD